MESIRSTQFPARKEFFNHFQQKHIDQQTYESAKQLYESKIASNEWKNMSDYLRHYNLLDVEPLVQALQSCFQNYSKYFHVDPMSKLSLPSIAFEAMYSLFDEKLPFVYSFNDFGDPIRQLFRDNVIGGLSTVFHRLHRVILCNFTHVFRDINLTDSESPIASKQAPNGQPYTSLIFLDFNSMYLWSQQQQLPLSPGIVWTLKNGKFKKKPLTNRQHSFESLQWLYYQQTKYNETIQHAFHQGEKVIYLDKQYKVDGYAIINGRKTIFEYNGCIYHGCPCIPNPTDKDEQDRLNWI